MNAMHRRLPLSLTLVASLAIATSAACGGKSEPAPAEKAPAPAAASSTPAPGTAAAPENGKTEAATDGPLDPSLAVAKIAFQSGERAITVGELQAFAEKKRTAKEPVRWSETFDEYAGLLLLADEATRNGTTEPANEQERAEAWAKAQIYPAAEQSVTDADMQAAFAERRSAVRVMFKTEQEATEMKASLADQLAKAPEMAEKVKLFKTRGGRVMGKTKEDETLAPVGVLFDANGKGDSGQGVVPPKVAETAFKLAQPGDVSDPVELASNRWLLVMLTGTRPATALEQVPADLRDRTKAGLATTRAVIAMKERVARLRRDYPVVVLDEGAAARALGLADGDMRNAKMRRVPFDMRKMRSDSLRGGPRNRMPGVERKDAPNPEKVDTKKVQEGMQP